MRKPSHRLLPVRPAERLSFSRILERRRDFVSAQLEEVYRENHRARILSVANGAAREAENVIDLCRSSSGTFVILDASGTPPDLFRLDTDLHMVRYISYPHGIIPSVDNIGEFHFIYSLNLLGELNPRQASAVIARLVSLLRPGGRCLVSSFTSEVADIHGTGIVRKEEDMAQLAPDSGLQQILGHAIWSDESHAVLYLEIQKAACSECLAS